MYDTNEKCNTMLLKCEFFRFTPPNHSEHLALHFVRRLGRRTEDMFGGHLVSSTLSMTQINSNYITEKLTSQVLDVITVCYYDKQTTQL